ncbi:hypothetical protein Nepgr_021996 [Nepenthes gracilis]|uniref:AN1-type domain-containing protein n=1 Tax=Nepenthes gracilis TaxID=150966 RepID=A0AAD3SZQ4_NEPGR|nr:hypothetical protein Nepgr_021996 [Nepenthes gracilis]
MGTLELPKLGKHCSVDDCKLIDFLPFTCDRCRQVFCLDHRTYTQHRCSRANRQDVTVVICPLCAKGVHLIPDEDPNITWEAHVNIDCDPSNYKSTTQKRKCPVAGCGEFLTFSNKIKCRDCCADHCLKHRFGPDHKCPGPGKPNTSIQFMGFLSRCRSRSLDTGPESNHPHPTSSSAWEILVNAASTVRATAKNGMAKLSRELNQASNTLNSQDAKRSSGSSGNGAEVCPLCQASFSSVTALVDHVERVHESSSNEARDVNIDLCPECRRAFQDPVALVEHVERDHRCL